MPDVLKPPNPQAAFPGCTLVVPSEALVGGFDGLRVWVGRVYKSAP